MSMEADAVPSRPSTLQQVAVTTAGAPSFVVTVVAGHLAGSIVPPLSDQFQVTVAFAYQPWRLAPLMTGFATGARSSLLLTQVPPSLSELVPSGQVVCDQMAPVTSTPSMRPVP